MKFAASLAACLPALALAQPALDLSKYSLHAVYRNDFTKPQKIAREDDFIERLADGTWRRIAKPPEDAEWIAEGSGGVEIRGGKLRVAPSPFDPAGRPIRTTERSHMVVWNRRIFPADFLLEFDISPERSSNGLTIVFLCATGKQGERHFRSLAATAPGRLPGVSQRRSRKLFGFLLEPQHRGRERHQSTA